MLESFPASYAKPLLIGAVVYGVFCASKLHQHSVQLSLLPIAPLKVVGVKNASLIRGPAKEAPELATEEPVGIKLGLL